MKRILTLSLALSFLVASFAAGTSTIVVPKKSSTPNANEILVPIGKNGQKVSLMDLSNMKTKDFETLTGKKLNLTNKLALKIMQKKLKNSIDANGNINSKMLNKATVKTKKADDGSKHYLKLCLIFVALAVIFAILGWVVPFIWILSYLAWLGAVIFFILWLVNKAGAM